MRRLFVLLLLPSVLGAVPARGEIIERIIAKVNGEIITLSDFQERQLTAAQVARVDPSQIGPFLRQHNARILQDAIDEILILQRAQDEGLSLRPEFVDEVIDSIKKDNKITSEEQFQEALDSEGLTLDELRKNIEHSWTRKMVLQRDIEPKLNVTDDEIKAEYEAHMAKDFTKPASVTLEEIFVSDEAGGATLAREIVAKARDGGDFAELARQYSSSPTAESGGALGEISQGDIDPALEKVAFSLDVGSVSDPIPAEDGVRILKVVAKTSGSVVPYETARAKIKDRLMMQQFEKEYDKYMEEIRSKAVVELRVREVPLTLSGPIPPDTLLEGVDPFSLGPTSALPGPSPSAAAPPPASGGDEISVTPQTRPEHVAPPPLPGVGEDEISTTPQAAPERVAPPAAAPSDEKTPPSR